MKIFRVLSATSVSAELYIRIFFEPSAEQAAFLRAKNGQTSDRATGLLTCSFILHPKNKPNGNPSTSTECTKQFLKFTKTAEISTIIV